ncbi:MAG: hypothetical protein J5968_07360 [Oscillospiraceae bacterium]|nr:hypothetical protein [Oscillospiraceae bacterium]
MGVGGALILYFWYKISAENKLRIYGKDGNLLQKRERLCKEIADYNGVYEGFVNIGLKLSRLH